MANTSSPTESEDDSNDETSQPGPAKRKRGKIAKQAKRAAENQGSSGVYVMKENMIYCNDRMMASYLGMDKSAQVVKLAEEPHNKPILEGWYASKQLGFGKKGKKVGSSFPLSRVFETMNGDDTSWTGWTTLPCLRRPSPTTAATFPGWWLCTSSLRTTLLWSVSPSILSASAPSMALTRKTGVGPTISSDGTCGGLKMTNLQRGTNAEAADLRLQLLSMLLAEKLPS